MPLQAPADSNCLDRLFSACEESVGLWLEGEEGMETPLHDVLKAIAGFSAYMMANVLKQSIKQEIPYDLIATINLWFLDSLRVGLDVERPDRITMGKGNGNGVEQ